MSSIAENSKPKLFKRSMTGLLKVKHSIMTEMMVLVGLILIIFTFVLAYTAFEQLYTEAKLESLKTLQSLANAKNDRVNDLLEQHSMHIESLAEVPTISQALADFSGVFKDAGVNSSAYQKVSEKYDPYLSHVLERGHYYDFFLINMAGDIVYTIKHESDYTTNLNTGEFRATGLSQVYHDAVNLLQSNNSSMEHYGPSNEVAGFVAAPVIHDGKLLGVVALQFDTDDFYAEVNDYSGLGASGEIVLGKRDQGDVLITAPLRHDAQATFKRRIDSNAANALPIRKGSLGEPGSGVFIDWRGEKVLAAWQYIPALDWGMVVKIDHDEVFSFWPELAQKLLAYILLGLLISYILLYVFMRYVISPLRQLTDASEAFTKGEHVNFEGLQRYDNEVGMLATSFMNMLQKVRESRIEVQQVVDELAENNSLLDERVLEKTEHIRAVVNASSDGILTLDQYGKILRVNPSFSQMLAYAPDELLGLEAVSLLLEKDQANYCLLLQQSISGETPGCYTEMQCARKNGASFAVELSINPMHVKGQKLFLLTVRDISDRKALELDQQRLSMLVNQVKDAIALTDIDGTVEYVNPAYESLSGYSGQEILGHNINIIKSGKMSNKFYENMWKTILSGRVWNAEFTNRNSRGELYDVDQTISPIFDADKQLIGFATIQRDIGTDRQDREKLEHAQRLESLGVLAGGIAHDFNNLLTAILGNAALAKNKLEPTSPVVEMLGNIEKSSERAAALCKQMLAYSGKGKFIVESIDMTDLIEEMINLLQVSMKKSVVMRLDLSQQLLPIEADVAQMQQVIMNLVINASEAIEDKSGVITIYTGVVDVDDNYLATTYLNNDLLPGRYISIEVSDTGCGMSSDTVKHIFDPFFTTKFTGRGLGMSAILGIVRGHQGAIKVYSEQGKGSTFKILFPSSAAALENKVIDVPKENGIANVSGTVLIVDDEETIRATASMMLTAVGFDVLTAKDGVEGVEMFKLHQDDIDVVLLDMTMPRMDGEEVFREIRGIDPQVKVILSSGYNQQDATNRFVGKGLAGFIQKPYMPAKLQEMVVGLVSE
ncbi:MAG: PAS domain S-box protein [Mariprofundaceae bacterium]